MRCQGSIIHNPQSLRFSMNNTLLAPSVLPRYSRDETMSLGHQ
jgi:hypothetical protein